MSTVRKNENGYYKFGNNVFARANPCLKKDILLELFNSFAFTASELHVSECEELEFRIGDAEPMSLDGYEYALRVTERGVYIGADSSEGLIHGFYSLLEMIEPVCLDEGAEELRIPCVTLLDKPDLSVRAVHLCLFPEDELWELEKYIRTAAVLKCTHIVLEFWGTLRFDVLDELAWREHSYTKDEIRPLVRLANDMGVKIIPMFNHWGHASLSRGRIGKHTVLDQNPRLATLFSRSGWVWNIGSQRVRELHAAIRRELIELCGECEFFHIGCDEAIICNDTSVYAEVAEYINEITDDIRACGRAPLMWGDMLLLKSRFDKERHYECNLRDEGVERIMLDSLSRDITVVDWQYEVTEAPFKTSEHLASLGFSVMTAPSDKTNANVACAVRTAQELSLDGVMHTTWHTRYKGVRPMTLALRRAWNRDFDWCDDEIMYSAAVVGKAHPARGNYERAGWAREQIALGFE